MTKVNHSQLAYLRQELGHRETLDQELGGLEAEVDRVEEAEDDHLVEVAVAPQLGPDGDDPFMTSTDIGSGM